MSTRATSMAKSTVDHRRAVADRNVEAILDATETLLAQNTPPSMSAVAAEARVSRQRSTATSRIARRSSVPSSLAR